MTNEPNRYTKKPVTIEAFQYGHTRVLPEWMMENPIVRYHPDRIEIKTLEGTMVASKGDWIIKGVKGEIYPCKPDIFEATYAPEGTDLTDELAEVLKIATQALEIGTDWNAPEAYDIEVPDSWKDAIDPEGDEPTWPTAYGIIDKCKVALSKHAKGAA